MWSGYRQPLGYDVDYSQQQMHWDIPPPGLFSRQQLNYNGDYYGGNGGHPNGMSNSYQRQRMQFRGGEFRNEVNPDVMPSNEMQIRRYSASSRGGRRNYNREGYGRKNQWQDKRRGQGARNKKGGNKNNKIRKNRLDAPPKKEVRFNLQPRSEPSKEKKLSGDYPSKSAAEETSGKDDFSSKDKVDGPNDKIGDLCTKSQLQDEFSQVKLTDENCIVPMEIRVCIVCRIGILSDSEKEVHFRTFFHRQQALAVGETHSQRRLNWSKCNLDLKDDLEPLDSQRSSCIQSNNEENDLSCHELQGDS